MVTPAYAAAADSAGPTGANATGPQDEVTLVSPASVATAAPAGAPEPQDELTLVTPVSVAAAASAGTTDPSPAPSAFMGTIVTNTIPQIGSHRDTPWASHRWTTDFMAQPPPLPHRAPFSTHNGIRDSPVDTHADLPPEPAPNWTMPHVTFRTESRCSWLTPFQQAESPQHAPDFQQGDWQ